MMHVEAIRADVTNGPDLNRQPTSHVDTFVIDNLPPRDQQPEFLFDLETLDFPEQLNCAAELLDRQVDKGLGDKVAIYAPGESLTYGALFSKANRIARVLSEDMGLVPGNRVLLRSPNNPMMVACWFGVIKAGGIVVSTMSLLRAKELGQIIRKGKIELAICDGRLSGEMEMARDAAPELKRILYYSGVSDDSDGYDLESLMEEKPVDYDNVQTIAADPVLIGFTSGTTGEPKACVHSHRDVMSMCVCVSDHVIKPDGDDVFIGSPPIAFTFGLGTLVTFPLYAGAATVLLENAAPLALAEAIETFGATICCTAPTAYRAILNEYPGELSASLKKCVSAGEHLPLSTYTAWEEKTGIKTINGIGATELIHIFISAAGDDIRPGATGKAVPGYQACIVDEKMTPLPVGEAGYLAVKGPTGCRYLDDNRQKKYVADGWNITGDIYKMDADGYFWFVSRGDDMIVTSGYNVSGPEVEGCILAHGAVAECAVVGAPDAERGNVIKAHVVLKKDAAPSEALAKDIQTFVKNRIAPYKYPRIIEFTDSLPKTETGKIQRFKLRGDNRA